MMNRNKYLISFLYMVLLLACYSCAGFAKQVKGDVVMEGQTAGVQGGVASLKTFCNTSECLTLVKELAPIERNIKKNNPQISFLESRLKKLKLDNSVDQVKLVSMINDLEHQIKDLFYEDPLYGQKYKDLTQRYESFSLEYNIRCIEDKINILRSSIQEKISENKSYCDLEKELALYQSQLEKLREDKTFSVQASSVGNDTLLQENFNQEEQNNDQLDVEPIPSSYLSSGNLIAWGIPGVGSFGVHVPQKPVQEKKNVTESTVKDETYQALRQVELESQKITDQDKTLFLQEISTQAQGQ